MSLHADDFGLFLAGVHGHNPFPWQQQLVNQLATSNEWPDVLNLPTGAGKTAALDAAVFHLALRADQPQLAALRICLVVDRRLVVDDAHTRAQKLAQALAHPETIANPDQRHVVKQVAQRLGSLAERRERPLVVQRLRGGVPSEHEWARTPTQPVILCSTVDQVGSRLLFRGYGVSARMRPVHAGLLGTNTLVLVDEAHIAVPFLQTLEAVRTIGCAKIKLALLSATPGISAKRQLQLSVQDRADPTLTHRLAATKQATLVKASRKSVDADIFCDQTVTMMARLLENGVDVPVIAVIVNRVELARRVFEKVKESGFDPVLLIGRCRAIVRDQLVADGLVPFKTGNAGRALADPLILVATQCLEVGVDVDLDGLVCQAAPLDALRQRFGRLNRGGRDIPAQGCVVALPGDLSKVTPDPVYGDRTRRTWDAITEIAKDGVVDFGIDAFDSLASTLEPSALAAPRPEAPVLMPAHLNFWASTSPIPATDPDIALFLHGKEPRSPDVSIVWRADITIRDIRQFGDDLPRLIALVPPRSTESVTVPIWAAQALFEAQERHAHATETGERPTLDETALDFDRVADVADGIGDGPVSATRYVTAFRWAGVDDAHTGPVTNADIRPGDVLVVPSDRGGCDEYGWHPNSHSHVRDVADEAGTAYAHGQYAVRVSRDIVDGKDEWNKIIHALGTDDHTVADLALVERVVGALPGDRENDGECARAQWRRDIRPCLSALREAVGRIEIHRYGERLHSAGGVVLVARRGLKHQDGHDEPTSFPSTENDEQSNGASGYLSLDRHSAEVETKARDTASTLGLEAVGEDVALAAYLHDAGKADRRFQVMLAGGDEWNMPDGEPMAKSAWGTRGAWRRARLPDRWRHEAQSVRMALAHRRFKEAHDPELVLWLIGTHHGLGRPFFEFVEDSPTTDLLPCLGVESWRPANAGPESLAFTHADKNWPDIFESLKRRYGIWGLAHLEAIIRLADHRASEQ